MTKYNETKHSEFGNTEQLWIPKEAVRIQKFPVNASQKYFLENFHLLWRVESHAALLRNLIIIFIRIQQAKTSTKDSSTLCPNALCTLIVRNTVLIKWNIAPLWIAQKQSGRAFCPAWPGPWLFSHSKHPLYIFAIAGMFLIALDAHKIDPRTAPFLFEQSDNPASL